MKKYTSLLFLVFAVQISYSQLTAFSPTSGMSGSDFGTAVAISNHDILVSSISDITSPGKVYLFDTTNGIEQIQTFYPDDALSTDAFGRTFSIAGDFIFIGAPLHDAVFENAGAAYIYKRTAGNWSFAQKLVLPDANANDNFGSNIEIFGDYLFISATKDEPAGDSVNRDKGSVSVYKWNGSEWDYSQQLTIAMPTTSGINDGHLGQHISYFNNVLQVSTSYGFATYVLAADSWVMQSYYTNMMWDGAGIGDFCYVGNKEYVITTYPAVYCSVDCWEYINGSWTHQDAAELDYWSEESRGQSWSVVRACNDKIFVGSNYYSDFIDPAPRKFPLRYYRNINNQLVFQTALYGDGPENTDDYFGSAMAVSGDYLVVGAPKEGNGKAYTINTTLLAAPTFAKNTVSIYPNPTNDVLHLKHGPNVVIAKASVYSVAGNLLFETQDTDAISLRNLAGGVYIVKLTCNDGSIQNIKAIKQ